MSQRKFDLDYDAIEGDCKVLGPLPHPSQRPTAGGGLGASGDGVTFESSLK